MQSVSVIITNYNYSQFIEDAIKSVLGQTYPFVELIVVDDGSNDDSVSIIKKYDSIKLFEQPNRGQLAALTTGFKACTGEIIFFLDADDTWDTCYVTEIVRVYQTLPDIDSVFCNKRTFGFVDGNASFANMPSRVVGYTLFDTLVVGAWVGAPMSCLSFKRDFLQRILPLRELESGWKIRADDVLIYASSLIGGLKYFCGDCFVNYRIHNKNGFYGTISSRNAAYKYELEKSKVFSHFSKDLFFTRMPELLYLEAKTNILSGYKGAREYLRLSKLVKPLHVRIIFLFKVLGLFIRFTLRHRAQRPTKS